MKETYSFFGSTPRYLEDILKDELRTFGANNIKETPGGVYFTGPLEAAYRICLWSRVGSRILLILDSFNIETKEDLYKNIKNIKWEEHFNIETSFSISCIVNQNNNFSSQYASLVAKDAIVDRFRKKYSNRPSVNTENPDFRIFLYLKQNTVEVSIDLSGESLHMRKYRIKTGIATLKENLAAAMLIRSGWPEIAKNGGLLIDPMCGSGTLLIEAALIAGNIAPGLLRNKFGFFKWLQHQEETWEKLISEANEKSIKGKKEIPPIFGYDEDSDAVKASKININSADLSPFITVNCKNVLYLYPPPGNTGLIVINPPYGERLGEIEKLNTLYKKLGHKLITDFEGWKASILTGNVNLSKQIGLKANRTNSLYNGNIKCILAHFYLEKNNIFSTENRHQMKISSEGEMFRNRIRKNIKKIKKWAKNSNVSCYRIYDRDLPEYAAAIDLYEGKWINIQEYKAPPEIEKEKTRKRLNEIIQISQEMLNIDKNCVFVRQRKRQKGKQQYEKLSTKSNFFKIKENNFKFLVNFTDYLDPGIFLDHRATRNIIKKMSIKKRFLNLFCYTGTATVYAAAGGALSTTSVDSSNSYLNRARENMKINGFSGKNHNFIHRDCLKWLSGSRDKYDLIFLDPPTFSNSGSRDYSFDLQKDHIELLKSTVKLLSKEGSLIFSCNYRKFRPDFSTFIDYSIEDITLSTIPEDFSRNKKIHYCWKIKRKTN